MVVAVRRWPCGGHMTCHVTWQDNPLRVTNIYSSSNKRANRGGVYRGNITVSRL